MSNSVWAAFLTLILISATWYALSLKPKAATVIVIHNMVWLGAIVLIGVNVINYRESSTQAWLTLTAALVAFNLGSLSAIAPRDPQGMTPVRRDIQPIISRPLLLVIITIYFICVAVYLFTITQRFGIETLFTDPAEIRGASGESYLESVPLIARLGLFLGPFLFAAIGFREAMSRPLPLPARLLLLATLTGTMLLLLQRTNLFMGVLWLVALYLSKDFSRLQTIAETEVATPLKGKKSSGFKVIPLVVAGLLLLSAFQVVGGALGKTGDQALSTGAVSEPLAKSGLTSVVVYYTAGIVAFLQLTDSTNYEEPRQRVQGEMRLGDNNPQTWGASTFGVLLKLIPTADAPDTINPFIDTGVLTNVFTWLEPYYRDFRLPGLIVAMFVLGAAITRMNVDRFISPMLFWIQAAFLSTVFLATFTTKINNTLFVSLLLMVLALGSVRKIRSSTSMPNSRSLADAAPRRELIRG